MKLTKKQIDLIVRHTPKELHMQPVNVWNADELGTYTPGGVNWSYHAHYIDYNGMPLLVVSRFGHII
jgi:putative NIF3 family GTP cyclohydrolase 1 type 2